MLTPNRKRPDPYEGVTGGVAALPRTAHGPKSIYTFASRKEILGNSLIRYLVIYFIIWLTEAPEAMEMHRISRFSSPARLRITPRIGSAGTAGRR